MRGGTAQMKRRDMSDEEDNEVDKLTGGGAA
jgi:hypothetical protein